MFQNNLKYEFFFEMFTSLKQEQVTYT